MDNKKRTSVVLHLVFLAFFVISILYVFYAHKNHKNMSFVFDDGSVVEWNDSWEINYDDDIETDISLPVDVPVERGKAVILKKKLPEKIKKYNCIMLEGRRQDISVSIGGIQRASVSNESIRPWGKTSPSGVVLVPIYNTDSLEDVAIVIKSNSSFSGKIGKIYLGNEKSLVVMSIKSNMLWLFLIAIVFIIGIISLVCFYIYNSTFTISRALHYLALFSIMSAVWGFSQSGLRQLFFDDLDVVESIGYCCYMLLPIPVLLYVNRVLDDEYKKLVHLYSYIIVTNYIVENILLWIFRIGFFEMRYVSHAIFIITVVSILFVCIREIDDGIDDGIKTLVIGTVGLFLGLLTEVSFQDVRLLGEGYNRYIGGAFIFAISAFVYIALCISREQRQKKDAENANMAKTLFLAAMSHEIKTPLNAMLGMNEMIMRDSNEDAICEYAANISDSGKSLLALVNNILDFSMIEAGKMDISATNYKMKPLLGDLISMAESLLSKTGIKFNVDINENLPTEYYGDGVRLKQVIANLLSNAIKFTSSGEITLTVKSRGINDDEIKLYISVSDTGSGIKKEDIGRLMDSFVRVDRVMNSSIEGTGLGLPIANQLLGLMGSKLEVTSEYGRGSDFHFEIAQKIIDKTPMGPIKARTEIKETKRKLNVSAPEIKVLAVDDNKVNLTVLKGILKSTQMNVDTCSSGADCLKLCRDNQYDIIFMDHMMPEMDGIETFKRLREDTTLLSNKSYVFVLTANTVSGAAKMYQECGFDYYLKKPIDIGELNDVLHKFIPAEKRNSL